ncbi:hypothetical protein NKG95_21080 [Mesorhizobium sp. M1423]|uniref:hypothetical protein n=1 Tax=Mesorhizobium sp. M1423 TaxID=2957101 RepID=UPI003337B346
MTDAPRAALDPRLDAVHITQERRRDDIFRRAAGEHPALGDTDAFVGEPEV